MYPSSGYSEHLLGIVDLHDAILLNGLDMIVRPKGVKVVLGEDAGITIDEGVVVRDLGSTAEHRGSRGSRDDAILHCDDIAVGLDSAVTFDNIFHGETSMRVWLE